MDEEIAHQVNSALVPLCTLLENPEDLGYYFHNAERCANLCTRNPDNRVECTLLFQVVCEGLRQRIEGFVGLELHGMQFDALHRQPTVLAIPDVGVQSLPLFGGSMERPISVVAVERLKRSLRNQEKLCLSLQKRKGPTVESLRTKEMGYRAKVNQACLTLLSKLGKSSPLLIPIYGEGDRVPNAKEMSYITKRFFQSNGRVIKANAVNNYCREFTNS